MYKLIYLKFDISYLSTRPQTGSPGAFASPHAPKGCAILFSYRRSRWKLCSPEIRLLLLLLWLFLSVGKPKYACQTRPFFQYLENIKNTLTLPT